MRDLILQHVSSFHKFFILVDAINESYCSREVLELLLQLVNDSKSIRLLVTSISSPASLLAESEMKDEPPISDVCMSNEDIEKDIELYINTRMEKERLLRRLSADSKTKLREKLLENANRM
jgi:hypothetical protein